MAICSHVLLAQSDLTKRTAYVYGTPAVGDGVTLNDGTNWAVEQLLGTMDETEIPKAFQIGW